VGVRQGAGEKKLSPTPSTALPPRFHYERVKNNDGLGAIFDALEYTVVPRRDARENPTEARSDLAAASTQQLGV
jgi:hypothetical protein